MHSVEDIQVIQSNMHYSHYEDVRLVNEREHSAQLPLATKYPVEHSVQVTESEHDVQWDIHYPH